MNNNNLQMGMSRGVIWLGMGLMALVAMTAAGCNLAATQFGTGQFTTTILDSDLPEGYPAEFAPLTVGDYIIDFRDDESFVVIKEGAEVLVGRYEASADSVVITDESGPFACVEPGTETGSYAWTQANGGMTLTPVDEPCLARMTVLAAKPWASQ